MKYEDMINKITLGDCMDYLKYMPDKSIDLVLTDPPYGISADKGTNGFGNSKNSRYEDSWDNNTPTKEVFDEILRISKRVVIFGGNYFTDKLPQNGHWLVWDKIGETEFKNPFSDCELIWTNIDRKIVKKYINKQQGFINDGDDRIHPTQKPLRLVSEILKDYSQDGDLILDCFSGSGTVAVACKENNRRFIAIEKNEQFYKDSIQRLNGISKDGQTSIFTDFESIGMVDD